MKKFILPAIMLILLGIGCTRTSPPPPKAPSAVQTPTAPQSSAAQFPDNLNEGEEDLKLLEDIE